MSRPQPEYVRLGRAGLKKTVPLGAGAMKADIRRVGLLKDHSALHRPPPWAASTATAFRTLLLVRVVSAMYSGIADCDETFNYWEPLHLLAHAPWPLGTSQSPFQTWEYSPQFAIRSWAYVAQYLPVASWLPALAKMEKRYAFFAVRLALAATSSLCEAFLVRAVAQVINPRVSRYFLALLVASAGMYEASTALLPSTFSMYTSALALSYAFYPSRAAALFPSNAAVASTPKYRTGLATGFFALGALLGWPFALALALPFVFEELFLASGQLVSAARLTEFRAARMTNWLRCVAAAGVIAVPIVAIDSLAYGRTVIGTLNIFVYNVLSSRRGAGPELYGVEPWHYYVQNLMLNFGPAFVLAMLSLPAVAVTLRFDRKRLALLPLAEEELKKKKGEEQLAGSSYTTLLIVRLAPLYLWLGILTLQPHKEERFVYPAYPLICFNAAVTIYLFRGLVERAFVKRTSSPYQASRTMLFSNLTSGACILTGLLSISRVLQTAPAQRAPIALLQHLGTYELPRVVAAHFPGTLSPSVLERINAGQHPVMTLEEMENLPRNWHRRGHKGHEREVPVVDLAPLTQLRNDGNGQEGIRLCYGKEWHRFPTHFLVPDGARVDFVRSEFRGILPKHFAVPPVSNPMPRLDALLGWAWPWKASTRALQDGFNDLNREEEDRYVDIATCDYLVDSDHPHRYADGSKPAPLEPRYAAAGSGEWERLMCRPLLDLPASRADAAASKAAKIRATIERAFWLPQRLRAGTNRHAELCLLRTTRSDSLATKQVQPTGA